MISKHLGRIVVLVVAALALLAVVTVLGRGQAMAVHTSPATVYVDAVSCPTGDGSLADPFCTLQDAVTHVNATAGSGDTIQVAAGTYTTNAQVVISEDLTISGASAVTTIIKPGFDTGNIGDARGWFLVNPGITFNLSDVTLDGTGNLVFQAIRQRGEGSVVNVAFKEIKYNESGPDYAGFAVAAFGTGPVDVTGSTFTEIGRVGVLYIDPGVSGSVFSGNTYTGKGVGNWLDYALDISAGIVKDVSNNIITGNRGVASVDGSTSAGILVTTFFAPGTTATITFNTITDSTDGIHVGYCIGPNNPVGSGCTGPDTSDVTASCNDIFGNDMGVVVSTAAPISAENNWWGAVSGPYHTSNPGGTGNGVSDNVDFVPFLTALVDPQDCPPAPTPTPTTIPPTVTPTPDPLVGGIVIDPDTGALALQTDSSSGTAGWLIAEMIAGTAAAAAVLGGGVLYARRRRVQ